MPRHALLIVENLPVPFDRRVWAEAKALCGDGWRVSVVARSSEADVMSAYRRHDVLAWPSTYEGFGMVLLEAMSQRLPVVATPVGCAPALVEPDRTGVVVPPRSPVALADGLARMLDDQGFARRCADAAFDKVRPYTWARSAADTLDVYARAVADRGNGRVH